MSNQTRTKVLFLITKSNWGGAQRYVYDLATTLDQSRYEPVVALGGDGELIDQLQAAGVRTVVLRAAQRDMSLGKELRLFWELCTLIRHEDPAVFHVNSSKAGGLGCFVGRLLGVNRVIFTAHGWAFNEHRPWWQRLAIKYFHWLTVLLSHHTIAVSSAMYAQLDWPMAQRRMSVINPGRTITEFADRPAARTQIATHCPAIAKYQDNTWLVIIAELHPIKQHHVLFAAMQTVVATSPAVRLVCIGDGALRDSLQRWITDHNLEDHIFLTGAIHEAGRLLKAADLFVLPSQSESYGYVLHEAGLAGVPIVASRVGGITDIIDDQTGTLVSTTDPAQLLAAIQAYIATPQLFQLPAQRLADKLASRTVADMQARTTAIYEME